jgi:hypothetical protein
MRVGELNVYLRAKESPCALLNIKHRTKKTCQPLIKQLIDWIWKLRFCGLLAFL